MTAPLESPAFKAFPQFNEDGLESIVNSKTSVDPSSALRHFPSKRPADRVGRALGARRAISIKELIESAEFFQNTRKYIRARHIVDLCCGHGLTGMLYAVLDQKVESVTLVDHVRHPCVNVILDCLSEVAPWTRDKVLFLKLADEEWHRIETRPSESAVLGVHACGFLTDRCLGFAVERGLPVAVMPCCYPYERCPAPTSVRQALGGELAFDVDRTYRLESSGHAVRWRYVPKAITPMNRILIGTR